MKHCTVCDQDHYHAAGCAYQGGEVICEYCGESWDEATPGYWPARNMLIASLWTICPSCEHDTSERTPLATS